MCQHRESNLLSVKTSAENKDYRNSGQSALVLNWIDALGFYNEGKLKSYIIFSVHSKATEFCVTIKPC